MQIGIVGLPNVGKSTLFNALTKQAAKAQNVPFTTIEPNIGVVAVPDKRLDILTEISRSKSTVPTTIEFVDIAGLVKNAHKGEGLGNQFLANIREVDAIVHVVRFFENEDITHVETNVDPIRDAEIVNTELALADLTNIQTMRTNLEKKIRGNDKEAAALDPILAKFEKALAAGTPVRNIELEDEEQELVKGISLLTEKPVLYIANISETQITNTEEVSAKFTKQYNPVLSISVQIEQELIELSDKERLTFLEEYGLKNTGLDRLIQASYKLLKLITFFTSGEQESRAWTVEKDSTAPQAAGKIHTDFERGFIRAETVAYDDLVSAKTYAQARAAGKVRDEGKEYIVKDGDVMLFKFSV